MPIEITMPALSPTMTEGNLVSWLKKEGDKIKSGDIIAEIETDKATMEVEATDSGILGKVIIQAGVENIKVGTLIALILEDGENPDVLKDYKAAVLTTSKPSATDAVNSATPHVKSTEAKPAAIVADDKNARIFASPLAKRIAEQNGVNLSGIIGSGPHGRIVKSDVETLKPSDQISFGGRGIERSQRDSRMIPHTNVRKVIARRLLESKQTIPHFYLSIDVAIDGLLSIRSQVNSLIEKQGSKSKISVNDLIIKASALALKDKPMVNASWDDGGMIVYENIDISVAVSIDGGLVTPIVRNADQKTIVQISDEMKDLAKRARENKLKPEEFQGGGFSISNLGMYGIKNFNAIVNPPQGAILSVGAGQKLPSVCDKTNAIVIKNIMNISISCDHRVVDGALGAEFINKIKEYLENPVALIMM